MTIGNPPRLILGTAQLVTEYGVTRREGPVRDDDEALGFLGAARAAGIGVLDTAPAYGRAEDVIGRAKAGFEIHTKVAKGVRASESLRESLRRLGASDVEVLYVHDIEEFRTRPGRFDAELSECLHSGARRVGVSVYEPGEVDLAVGCDSVRIVQVPMNVLDQRFVAMSPRLAASGVGCVVRSVFLQGSLLCEPDELPARVRHLAPQVKEFHSRCRQTGVSPLVGCLAFVAHCPGVEGVIVGAQTVDEMESIVCAWREATSSEGIAHEMRDFAVSDDAGVDPRYWT